MISYHFGGKRKLYRDILLEIFSAGAARLQAIRESDLPADQRLRDFIAAFAEIVRSRPSLPPMMLREVLTGGRFLDQRILPHFLGVFSLVREIIEQGVREGTFRPVDPAFTHISLLGGIILFFSTGAFRSRLESERAKGLATLDPEAFVQHMQELMIRGLSEQVALSPAASLLSAHSAASPVRSPIPARLAPTPAAPPRPAGRKGRR